MDAGRARTCAHWSCCTRRVLRAPVACVPWRARRRRM